MKNDHLNIIKDIFDMMERQDEQFVDFRKFIDNASKFYYLIKVIHKSI